MYQTAHATHERKIGYNVVMSEKERKSSLSGLSLRWDRQKTPALPEGKTGIHSVDAANEIAQEIAGAHNKAEKAAEDSLVDVLTECYNRKFWNKYVAETFHPSRDDGNIGLVSIDLNNLKTTNDTIGYDAGDHLIIETVEFLRSNVRKSDIIVRYGGDEFVIICHGDGEDHDFAQNLSTFIEERRIDKSGPNFASGVVVYDKDLDKYDLNNTRERAELEMKKRKKEMKGEVQDTNDVSIAV